MPQPKGSTKTRPKRRLRQVCFNVTPGTLDRIDAVADAEGRPRSNYLRLLVERDLAEREGAAA